MILHTTNWSEINTPKPHHPTSQSLESLFLSWHIIPPPLRNSPALIQHLPKSPPLCYTNFLHTISPSPLPFPSTLEYPWAMKHRSPDTQLQCCYLIFYSHPRSVFGSAIILQVGDCSIKIAMTPARNNYCTESAEKKLCQTHLLIEKACSDRKYRERSDGKYMYRWIELPLAKDTFQNELLTQSWQSWDPPLLLKIKSIRNSN